MAEYIERELAEKEIFIKQNQERQHWMEYLDQRKGTKEYSSAEKSVDNWLRGYSEAVENVLAIFDKLSADVEHVKHGKWASMLVKRPDWEGNMQSYYQPNTCSKCHVGLAEKTNYCPNCGAKMDGKEVQE